MCQIVLNEVALDTHMVFVLSRNKEERTHEYMYLACAYIGTCQNIISHLCLV